MEKGYVCPRRQYDSNHMLQDGSKKNERGHGVQLAWNHERFSSDDYVSIHTRTSHMTADIYTKGFNDANTWRRLRRLINIYTPEELSNGWLSPETHSYLAKDVEGVEVDIKDVNPHYTYIMSGESELNTDFRNRQNPSRKRRQKPSPKPKERATQFLVLSRVKFQILTVRLLGILGFMRPITKLLKSQVTVRLQTPKLMRLQLFGLLVKGFRRSMISHRKISSGR